MDKILTVNDVAGILQVKAITVREMFRESRLRGFKVGKAWRTTQEMLEQDIAALARGESPGATPAQTQAPRKARPAKVAAEDTQASRETAGEAPETKPARAKKARKPEGEPSNNHKEITEEAEDTQQLLF